MALLHRHAFLATLLLISIGPAAAQNLLQDCPECPELVVLEAGEFTMGSDASALERPFLAPDRVLGEQPPQRIRLANGFAIGRTEVTVGEYRQFIEATGHQSSECLNYDFERKLWLPTGHDWADPGFEQSEEHPAVCLSWYDAQAYVEWLSEHTGQSYRLPSEAEWEYAARAGTQTLFPWGEDKDLACDYSNSSDQSGLRAGVSSAQGGTFDCDDGHVYTAPAHFGQPNAWGIHGMIGNAGEWQQDCLVRTLEGAPADGGIRSNDSCLERPMRGGSWFNPPLYNRPAFRYGTTPDRAFTLVGIRVLREL